MGFSLKNKVLANGFNKQAVIIAIGIVAVIMISFVIYVVVSNPLSAKAHNEINKKIDINDNTPNLATIIDITTPKRAASATAVESSTKLVDLDKPMDKLNTENKKISETEYDKQVKQITDQAKMKKLQAQYAALDSKSSMTDSKNKDSNTSVVSKHSESSTSDSKSKVTASNPVTTQNSELVSPKSPYLIQAGSIIPCVMISGINSDISGQVIAQVRENVYDSINGSYLLIPQGSKLLGTYSNQVAYGQKRLGVAWTRVIYPNGYSIDLKGIPGSDVAGFNGFYDQVDNHYWSIFGSSFVIGVITAGMQYSQNNTNPDAQIGGLGVSTSPSIGQTVAGSLGQQLGQTAMMITQKGLNVAPTLTIRQGYMFTVMLTADIALRPYITKVTQVDD